MYTCIAEGQLKNEIAVIFDTMQVDHLDPPLSYHNTRERVVLSTSHGQPM